ncbi:hypothetical protein E1091_05605 [Micromonospora fluostatini]|uniref:Uncharacterized protein n=1 Tax=Micromonospora fluostatini TaxID=1629071 RepID=A0ABY2DJ93_9ACTN|nr:hypothetical protein E1091_05605 [Micromonospora fluostatini]
MSRKLPGFGRRGVLLAGLAVGVASAVRPAAAEAATTKGGLADVTGGSIERLSVRMRDTGRVLTVPTVDFPESWTFQTGDTVCVTTANDGTNILVAKPFLRVIDQPDRRDVFVFNRDTGARRAAIATRARR